MKSMLFYSYHLFFYKANNLTMTIVLSMSCAGSMSVPNFHVHVHVPVQVCVYVCIRVRPPSAPETPNFVLLHSYFHYLWSLFLNSGYYFPSPFSFFPYLRCVSCLLNYIPDTPPPTPPPPTHPPQPTLPNPSIMRKA
jgi:hypothetical protein